MEAVFKVNRKSRAIKYKLRQYLITLRYFLEVQFFVFIICIISSFTSYVVAQTIPAPTTNQGTTDAATIVDGAINGSQLVVDSFNNDWRDLANGNSAVYIAIVKVSLLIATIIVAFWSVGLLREVADYGFSIKMLEQIAYPTIVVLMLGISNGALLSDTALVFRETSNYVNKQVLSITRNGIRFSEAIREVNMDQAFSAAVREKLQQCEKQPGNTSGQTKSPQESCKDNVLNDAQKQATDYRNKYQLPSYPNSVNPLDWGKEILNSAVQAIIWIIFSGLESAFQFGLQMSFLLNAYVGPIFLVLSLLPIGAKPIYAWLSGWLALGLILVSYSIIVGIAASSVVNASSTNPLFFQLIEAIFSPILAVVLGAAGGAALFTGFVSSARIFF